MIQLLNTRGVVALLLSAAFVVLAWTLVAVRAGAQEEEECTLVETFEGTGNQTTDLFDISTNEWFVSYEFLDSGQGENLSMSISVTNESGENIEANLSDTEGSPQDASIGEYVVNSPPGRYRLEIQPSSPDREYVVDVLEECVSTSSGETTGTGGTTGPESTTPSPSPAPTPAPAPAPRPPSNDGTLMKAGGAQNGPLPTMPGGGCPKEFPVKREGACYR